MLDLLLLFAAYQINSIPHRLLSRVLCFDLTRVNEMHESMGNHGTHDIDVYCTEHCDSSVHITHRMQMMMHKTSRALALPSSASTCISLASTPQKCRRIKSSEALPQLNYSVLVFFMTLFASASDVLRVYPLLHWLRLLFFEYSRRFRGSQEIWQSV